MRKVLLSIGILTGERVLQVVVSAAASIFVARALGPRDFGVFAFVLSSVALVGPLVEVGQSILVRDLVATPGRARQLLGVASRVALAIGIIVQPFAIAMALALPERLSSARAPLIIASAALLIRPTLVLDFWFQARIDARTASLARLSGLIAGSTCRVLVVVRGGPDVLSLLAATTILEAAITGGLMYVAFRRRVARDDPSELLEVSHWDYFRRIAPLLVAGLSVALYMRLDQVMLGFLSNAEQTGQYAAAVRVSEITYFIPVALMTSLAPSLTRLYARSNRAFGLLYDKVVSGFAATSFVLLVILLVGAPFLIGMLFGAEFDEASHVLRVHVLSLPFVFLGVSQTTWTAVYDLQKLAMWRTLGGAVINAALNLLLIPSHGAVGAAVATVVAYGFAAIGGNALSSRTRPFLVMQLRQASPLHVARNLKGLVGDVQSRLAREPRGRT